MGFVGTYSNTEAMERVRRLLPKLEKLAAARGRTPSPRAMVKRERAPVLSAVAQILTEVEAPLRAREIHASVEVLRGEPVSWSSVKDCLASNAGPGGRFIRITRGRYRLA